VDIQAMCEVAWQIAEEKGHHENLSTIPLREATLVRLALVHSEVSEAVQHVKRHGLLPNTTYLQGDLAEELADIMIRVGELAEGLGIDLSLAIVKKFAKNRERPMYFGTPQEQVEVK